MQKIIFTIFISVLLSSCSSAMKQKVGLESAAPDELQVEKQRPLYVPPHYELPEPPTYTPGLPAKKKSNWMFWKKDKAQLDTTTYEETEKVEVQEVPKKRKWFWQR